MGIPDPKDLGLVLQLGNFKTTSGLANGGLVRVHLVPYRIHVWHFFPAFTTKNQVNVGKYTIHGSYGYRCCFFYPS